MPNHLGPISGPTVHLLPLYLPNSALCDEVNYVIVCFTRESTIPKNQPKPETKKKISQNSKTEKQNLRTSCKVAPETEVQKKSCKMIGARVHRCQ